MTTTQRLKAIEARCKALGWDCEINHYKDRAGDCIRVELRDTSGGWLELHGSLAPAAAESLLTLHEPGPTVTIAPCDTSPKGLECWKCPQSYNPGEFQSMSCKLDWKFSHIADDGIQRPTELCPGPGRYKLVPMDGDE